MQTAGAVCLFTPLFTVHMLNNAMWRLTLNLLTDTAGRKIEL
jgi:hypothetical protein